MKKAGITALMKVIAVLVLVLGVIMLGRGLNLSGIGLPMFDTHAADIAQFALVEGNGQTVSIDVQPHKYAPIVVQKGMPVRFIIKVEASNLNGCNNTIVIPKYEILKALHPGENIIEFTPRETGDIPYSCQMGMIKSKIRVVADMVKSKATSIN